MGAAQSAEAEADVDGGAVPSEPSAAAPEDVDPDKWSEEFAREYRRLRQAELGEDEDASEEPEQLDELSSISPARVALKEMMVKASLSEIQSMLGPVIARGAGPEPDGAVGEHRMPNGARQRGDERENGGPFKRQRLGSMADGPGGPMEYGCSSTDGDDGRRTPLTWPEDDVGPHAQQRHNVSELNATMEAALSALYDDGGISTPLIHGLGTPQYTLQTPPDARNAMEPLHLSSPAMGASRSAPSKYSQGMLSNGYHTGNSSDRGRYSAGGRLNRGDGGGGGGGEYGEYSGGNGHYDEQDNTEERLFGAGPPELYSNGDEGGGGSGGKGKGGKGAWEGKIWTHAEDTIILEGVAQMGFKWRRIAAMLPNRSDDAVRNRWHRLEEARRHNDASGGGEAAYERASVYKCSRCGQPKKHHVCLAPDEASRAEEAKAKKTAAKEQQRLTWSREEDEIILQSVDEFGPKWLDIAARLPGRTDHAARNRYHRLQRCHRPADALGTEPSSGVPVMHEGGAGGDGGGGGVVGSEGGAEQFDDAASDAAQAKLEAIQREIAGPEAAVHSPPAVHSVSGGGSY